MASTTTTEGTTGTDNYTTETSALTSDITSTTSSITTSTSPTSASTGAGKSDDKLAIIGGVVGGVAFLIIIVVIIVLLLYCRRRRRKQKRPPPELPDPHYVPAGAHQNVRYTTHSGDDDASVELGTASNGGHFTSHKTSAITPQSQNGHDNPSFDSSRRNSQETGDNIYANDENEHNRDSTYTSPDNPALIRANRLPHSPSLPPPRTVGSPTSPQRDGDRFKIDSLKYLKPTQSQRPADRKPPALIPAAASEPHINLSKAGMKWQVKPPIIHQAEPDTDGDDGKGSTYWRMGEPQNRMSLTPPSPKSPDVRSPTIPGARAPPPPPCKGSVSKGYINVPSDNSHLNVSSDNQSLSSTPEASGNYEAILNEDAQSIPEASGNYEPIIRRESREENENNDENYENVREMFGQSYVAPSELRTIEKGTGGQHAISGSSVTSDQQDNLSTNSLETEENYINVSEVMPARARNQSHNDDAASQHSREGSINGGATPELSEDEGQPSSLKYENVEKYGKGVPSTPDPETPLSPESQAPNFPSQLSSSVSTTGNTNQSPSPHKRSKPPKPSPKPPKPSLNSNISNSGNANGASNLNDSTQNTESDDNGSNGGKRAPLPPPKLPKPHSSASKGYINDSVIKAASQSRHEHSHDLQHEENTDEAYEEDVYENADEVLPNKSHAPQISVKPTHTKSVTHNGRQPRHGSFDAASSDTVESASPSSSESPALKAKKMAQYGSSNSLDSLGKVDLSELKSKLKKTSQ